MSNILLTGGRSPTTLELARALHRAGHSIFTAESLRGHLSEPSNTVKRNFFIPPPRQQTHEFIQTLKRIITENKIDLLIPTHEEVFYVAMGRSQLPCKVFVESLEKLNTIHNKWTFILKAIEHDLSVPETILIANVDDLLHAYAQWRGLVLKPIYSRFAARTFTLPPLKQALTKLTFDSPWIAQEYTDGQQICTYSIAHNGHITAHTAYLSEFKARQGAAIVFRPMDHQMTFEWVMAFVKATHFTGQIAFDFIETPNGEIFALECYPHTTSGVHILARNPEFIDSLFNESMPCITPQNHSSYMLSAVMLTHGLPSSILNGHFGKWLHTFFTSDDVIFDKKDLKPFLLQFRGVFSYLKLARQHGISMLEATTFDVEWNGKEARP